MDEMNRYMIIIIGNSKGIEKDLNFIADRERGIEFVDSKVLFLGTFFSPYSAGNIHEKLAHRPAFMLFDITDNESYGINLPAKYYMGLFPETKEILDKTPEINNVNKSKGVSNAKSKAVTNQKNVEEYTTMNEILDKLSRNEYNRDCLTKKEIEILDSQK